MKQYTIYLCQNNISGKVYIGQTCQPVTKRWKRHQSEARAGSDLYFHRALRKYGENSFSWYSIDEATSQEQANDLEILYIDIFNSMDDDFGYNTRDGGTTGVLTKDIIERIAEKNRIRLQDPSERLKLSEARKGKCCGEENPNYGKFGEDHPRFGTANTPEHKAKLRDLLKNKWQDPKFRQQLTEFMKTREFTDEWREKMSASAKRLWDEGKRPRKASEETCRKRSESLLKLYAEHPKQPTTSETRKKQSQALKGRPWSVARRAAQDAKQAAKVQ